MKRPSRSRRTTRLLLIAVSPARELLLRADPGLVKELVETHVSGKAIPGALEVSEWTALERAFAERPDGEGPGAIDAIAPRLGLPLYEDRDVEASRYLRSADVARVVDALRRLPPSAREGSAFDSVLGFYEGLRGAGNGALVIRYKG